MSGSEYVWLIEYGVRAELVSMRAFDSTVRFTLGGVDYEVQVTNDEFEFWDEWHNGRD